MEKSKQPLLKPSCADCYFHDAKIADDKSIKMLCRIEPPQLVSCWVPTQTPGVMQILSQVLWRVVEPTDWCGKFSVDRPTN